MSRAFPLALGLACVVASAARPAHAAAEFVYRGITLPRGDVALDLGLGFGHAPIDANRSYNGFGMNLEIAGGITHELELGLRTGFRFDDDGQATQADSYGRAYETETFGTGHDRVANPELELRWSVARGSAVQIALETRAYLPFETGTRFGLMFGVPLVLRLANVRVDTGVYVPILFYDPTATAVSIPVHLWIQASPSFWLGPLFGLRIDDRTGGPREKYPFGFGFGWAAARAIDLRTWILFPHLNGDQAARTFGAGLSLSIRFE
ncbi:MAG TPA: hypothetical protein VHJ20_05600 [Polyangia bacterium]|nr:hypothetical protein [Polyangia bacterium]